MSVFDDLVGQEHLISVLQSALTASRNGGESPETSTHGMTHAWIFTGPPGSGRSSAAIAFAAALVCPSGGCGTCNECRSVYSGGHPDVEIIRTEGLSIKIDEVETKYKNSDFSYDKNDFSIKEMNNIKIDGYYYNYKGMVCN